MLKICLRSSKQPMFHAEGDILQSQFASGGHEALA